MHLTADIDNNLGSLEHCKQPQQLQQIPRPASCTPGGLRSMHVQVARVQDSALTLLQRQAAPGQITTP